MRLTTWTLSKGLRQWLGFFIFFYACIVAVSANAAVTAGTIGFAGTSGNTVTQQYNGLDFMQGSGWIYDDAPNGATNFTIPSITPLDGTSGGPGIVKVVNTSDRFNLTSVKVIGYYGDNSVTVQAYRSGNTVGSPVTLTSNGTSFSTHEVSLTNIDELRFYNADGFFSVDDLVVAPYAASLSLSPTTLSAATVATAYNQTITASGGTSPYTYAVTAGALPAGMTLNSAGALSGTPTAGGSFNFTITATDSTGGTPVTGSQAYTLTVNAPTISVSPTSLPDGTLSVAYNQAITASGGTAPHIYAITAGALPTGLSLSSGGSLSGTPGASGTFNFTVTATDSSTGSGPYPGSRAYALTIMAAPTATTGAASTITATGATLGGTVSSNGASTTVTFEYGLTTGYGSSATASQSPLAAGASNSSVSAPITGLTCNTTYHFRVKAVNSVGTTNGNDATFTTSACAPTATTGSATSITASGATLDGTVSSNGSSTTVTFEYGLNIGYGSSATASQSPLSAGASNSSVSAGLSGLSCNTTYHFRLKAVNGIATSNGLDASFTTAACPSSATTNAASAISANAATLNATVNDNGAATSVSFDWGTSVSYGNSASATPATVAAGAGSTAVSGSLSGLTCNTVYHYRVSATSTAGTTQGSDVSFTTGPCVPGAPTIGTATAGNAQATVSFTAPASNGGAAITGYTVTSNPGGLTGTGATTPITVSGLTNGTAYTFTVTATNSAGTGSASAASNSVTPKGSQIITFDNPGAQNFGTSPTLSASSDSGLSVSFTSSTTGVCTITSGGALSFVSAGSCAINADQAGDGSYLAAPQVSRTFTVNPVVPGAPTIGTATAGDTQASVSFTAPASNGGAAIIGYTVTVSPPDVAPVNGSGSPIVVTGLTNGQAYTFSVTAENSAGTGPASATSNSVTPAASQTITFANPGAQNFGTSPTLSASSDSGLSVSFTSSTTGVCTITSGGVLTLVTVGSCTINANQGGDASYLPAPQVSRTFTVNAVQPGAPTIGTATAGDTQASVAFTAPVSNGGAAITGYTVTSSPGGLTGTGAASPITVSGLTNGTAYTFTVTATNSVGTGSASAASNSVTPAASQTISFANPGAQTLGTTPTLTATTSSGLTLLFSSATPTICTVNSLGVLELLAEGTCIISVAQPGNDVWLPAQTKIQSFAINPVPNNPPVISGTPVTSVESGKVYQFTPTATDADQGASLTFSITNKPTWASFDTTTGTLSGTPTANDIGSTANIIISVSDGIVSVSLPAFDLQVVQASLEPVLTVPQTLVVNASALYTRVNLRQLVGLLDTASEAELKSALSNLATDGADGSACCTTQPEGLDVSNSLRLAPGTHQVRWTATNKTGNSASAIQLVKVRPLVSVSKSQVVSRGSDVQFKVILNGEAPDYPLEVPYVIDASSTATSAEHSLVNGVARFTDASQREVVVPVTLHPLNNLDDSTLVVRLDGDINPGPQRVHKIEIRNGNIAPTVNLHLVQNGAKTSLITPTGGPVTVTAEVADANVGDSHSYAWSADNPIVDSDGKPEDGVFVFDPTTLAGSYRLQVVVTDAAGATAEDFTNFRTVDKLPELSNATDSDGDGVDDLTEGSGDNNGNGIPNYLDNQPSTNILPQTGAVTNSYLLECEPGVLCGVGRFALGGGSGGALIFGDELNTANQLQPDAAFTPVGGIFDFNIKMLPIPGQSVRVVIPQRAPIPDNAIYRKYQNGQWVNFVENAHNALHSAPGEMGYCPPPGADSWQPGLVAGYLCTQLTIEDGGPNDDDGRINGAIVDPGAVSSLNPVIPPAQTTLNTSGGGAVDGLLLLVLAGLGVARSLRLPQLMLALAALTGTNAQAAGLDSFYVRGDLYQARGNQEQSNLVNALGEEGIAATVSTYDVSRVAYQLALGYHWNDFTYTELGYLDLGEVTVNLTLDSNADAATVANSLKQHYPASGDGITLVQGLGYPLSYGWRPAAELGLFVRHGDIDAEVANVSLNYDDSIEPLLGVRLDYQINDAFGIGFGLRRVFFDGQHVDLYGVSTSWQF